MRRSEPAIVVLAASGFGTARSIQRAWGGTIWGLAGRVDGADLEFEVVGDLVRRLFGEGTPIVAVMATGALVRLLAPVLADKLTEPPVVAVAQDGSAVVPLLGGHHGANELATDVAEALNAKAAITTAGEVVHGLAVDDPPPGWTLAPAIDAKRLAADLLASGGGTVEGDAADLLDWMPAGPTRIVASVGESEATYHPAVLAVGVGCERHCAADELIALVLDTLADANLSPHAVAAVTSIDLKADEAAVSAVAEALNVPARFFSSERLEAEADRFQNPSDVVFAEVGCHGVAEGAALALAGPESELIVPKRKSARATVAIARSPALIRPDEHGRARGSLAVVGIGPGDAAWRSPEVTRLIERSTDLVGYSLYLDLLGPMAERRTRHDFALGREEDRVRHAMELAGEGRDVALVCSGDAGIYAMAALVFECLDKGEVSDAASRIAIEVSPGISALQAAAARAGAPLGHDFCTISLSDLLTPWTVIQSRVTAAAEGDFVIAFYNPVSRRRRTQLAHARDVLLEHRPADTPVILATNLGREGELVRTVPLSQLNVDEVDMLTVVIVGSSETRTVETGAGRTWTYTPRGYAAKEGTRIVTASRRKEEPA